MVITQPRSIYVYGKFGSDLCPNLPQTKASKLSNFGRARASALFYTLAMDKTRARRLIRYIDSKLDEKPEDLSLESLSKHFGYSRFHFHRQSQSDIGLGLYRYIQLMRLKRAAFHLAFRGKNKANPKSLTDIALASGYESLEAFNRVFKQKLGQRPAEFRDNPDWATFHQVYKELSTARRKILSSDFQSLYKESDVQLVDFPETPVAVMRHHGDPALLGQTIQKFIAWRKSHHLPPNKSATYNFFYGGPDDTPPEDFRLDLACSLESRQKSEAPVATEKVEEIQFKSIPAGLCATLRVVGGDDALDGAANYLYRVWLEKKQNKYALRDFPLYARRLVFYPDVAENEAVTELYLPII